MAKANRKSNTTQPVTKLSPKQIPPRNMLKAKPSAATEKTNFVFMAINVA